MTGAVCRNPLWAVVVGGGGARGVDGRQLVLVEAAAGASPPPTTKLTTVDMRQRKHRGPNSGAISRWRRVLHSTVGFLKRLRIVKPT